MFLLEKMVNPLQNALFKRCWIEKAINKERQKRAEKSKTEFEPIEHFYPHALGHSHASLLIEHGFSPLLIAERLGHENIETTLNTYGHLYPHRQSELAANLQSLYLTYDKQED